MKNTTFQDDNTFVKILMGIQQQQINLNEQSIFRFEIKDEKEEKADQFHSSSPISTNSDDSEEFKPTKVV